MTTAARQSIDRAPGDQDRLITGMNDKFKGGDQPVLLTGTSTDEATMREPSFTGPITHARAHTRLQSIDF